MTSISNTRLRGILIVLLITINLKISAQEMLGLTMGNYKGIAGNLVNPAGMTSNKVFLDINLVSADVFLRNNFAYIPKNDFFIWDALKKGYEFPTYGEYNRNVIYYDNQKKKNVSGSIKVLGPSAMLQVGEHAFGITTAARVFISADKIPYDVAVFGYNGLEYTQLHNIEFDSKNANSNVSSWMEVGLSYAYNIHNSYEEQLTVGLSVKKLWGYAGGYVFANDVKYEVPNDSTVDIKNLTSEVGFSLPVDYDNNDFINTGKNFRGSGLGFDIGAVFVKKKEFETNKWRKGPLCSQKFTDYIYKIGVSIIDIGRVKYTTNAQLHNFNDVSRYWESIDTMQFNNTNAFMQQLSNTFYGNPNASFTDNTIKIGLPTAISIQADVSVQKNIYVAGFWIHPIRFKKNTLRRPAQIAVIPRFETKYFELSIPLSLYEYQYPQVGFAARLYFITIGTERLGTYLGMADMNGLDIYASIKIGINKGSCRKKFGGACDNANFGNKYSKRRGF